MYKIAFYSAAEVTEVIRWACLEELLLANSARNYNSAFYSAPYMLCLFPCRDRTLTLKTCNHVSFGECCTL